MSEYLQYKFVRLANFPANICKHLIEKHPGLITWFANNPHVPAAMFIDKKLNSNAATTVMKRTDEQYLAWWLKEPKDKRVTVFHALCDTFHLSANDQLLLAAKTPVGDIANTVWDHVGNRARLTMLKKVDAPRIRDWLKCAPDISDVEYATAATAVAAQGLTCPGAMFDRPQIADILIADGTLNALQVAVLGDLTSTQAGAIVELTDFSGVELFSDGLELVEGLLDQASLLDVHRQHIYDTLSEKIVVSVRRDGAVAVGSTFAPQCKLSELVDEQLVEVFAQRAHFSTARAFKMFNLLNAPGCTVDTGIMLVGRWTWSFEASTSIERYRSFIERYDLEGPTTTTRLNRFADTDEGFITARCNLQREDMRAETSPKSWLGTRLALDGPFSCESSVVVSSLGNSSDIFSMQEPSSYLHHRFTQPGVLTERAYDITVALMATVTDERTWEELANAAVTLAK